MLNRIDYQGHSFQFNFKLNCRCGALRADHVINFVITVRAPGVDVGVVAGQKHDPDVTGRY